MKNSQQQLEILKRGVVDLVNEEELLAKLKKGKPLRVKAGFDPTAADLHLGHTVVMQKLRQFQELGHQIIFLIGDFTARIGDPSGRNEARPMLSEEVITKNAETYLTQASKIIDITKTEVRYNSEWLGKMSVLEFAALGAKQTVARMLERDDFKKRMREGHDVSLLEFYYPLMQAQDSVALRADVELGGTDQIFNLLMGRTIQKRSAQESQVVITLPLLVGTDGVQKMSKSYGNHIGITESPREMFGKIMSLSDELMWNYYELLSSHEMNEIRLWQKEVKEEKRHPKKVKQALAFQLVLRFHGKTEAQEAQEEFEKVFSKKEKPTEMPRLQCLSTTPLLKVVTEAHLVKSGSDFRRLVEQGAVFLDDQKVTDALLKLSRGKHVLKVGKKTFVELMVQEK